MFDDPPPPGEQTSTPQRRFDASPMDGLVVLDTDLGWDPDDFVTVVIAARTIPNLAVVTADETHGRRALLARHVLDLLDRPDVPVITGIDIGGAHRFLINDDFGELDQHPYDVTAAADHLVDAVAQLCATTAGPIRWVGMGPMTNLTALLTYTPDLAERLMVTQMGGWLDRYRDKTRASHNFRTDPVSAGLALRALHAPRLVLSDYTNCNIIQITRKWALLHRLQSPTAPAWAQLLATHFEAWFGWRAGSWMHDPLTLSAALGLPFVTFRPERIRIARDARLYRDPNGRLMEISCAVDYDSFLDWLHEGVSA
ncbi:nucleoside hydrolase [Nocardia pneumoniae]|uniref:nucleoside hydrolase n=1 Tax=Nocardia pneumoniae TaxID=228601 RepID=UPI0002E6C727|nr:nucleoside hydrolase [Nocardia pneumoniae]